MQMKAALPPLGWACKRTRVPLQAPGPRPPSMTMGMKTGFGDSLGPHITGWRRVACQPETPTLDDCVSEKQNSVVFEPVRHGAYE